jgi:alpha-galactosidase
MRYSCSFFLLLLFLTPGFAQDNHKITWLSALDLSKMAQGTGKPKIDKNADIKPLAISKQIFLRGVGTQVKSYLWLDLGGGSEKFSAYVGIDDDTTKEAYRTAHNFKILGDGKMLWESGPMNYGDKAKKVEVNLKGINTLILVVVNTGNRTSYIQADWADACFVVNGKDPKTIDPPTEASVILTPKPGTKPKINGPTVFGCRPNNDFLYRIPATGERPMFFATENLPAGLILDPQTGIITGTVKNKGAYTVTLKTKNIKGSDSRQFKIICGNTIALTPTMGWNTWYAYYGNISERLMRDAADSIISNGMADVGYQYIDIDDCWAYAEKSAAVSRVGPPRDKNGNILPNTSLFPDMKGMVDYIHSRGLRAGIYSSPGPTTCAGYAGSYNHEAQDAKQFADWGFDLLKYDWCSYGKIDNSTTDIARQKPYRIMGSILQQQNRDIVFNLCQYGMNQVWKWGEEVGGNSWRTGGDLGYRLNKLFEIAVKNTEYGAFVKPGAWSDPDYIQVGYLGNAPTKLTPNEQYSFMSLWCLLAAPLVYSGSLNKMDDFTLSILCNPEVSEVDQDALGRVAKVFPKSDESFLMVKEMEDGSKAIGLCNSGEIPVSVTIEFSAIGLTGKQVIRDVWRQKNLGTFRNKFTTTVPRHGVVLVRIKKSRN